MIIIDTILLFTRTRPTEEFYGLSQVIFTYNSTGNQKFHHFCKMILYAKRQEKPCPQNFLRPVTVISSRMDAFVILPGRNVFLVNTFGTLFEKESKRINKQKKKEERKFSLDVYNSYFGNLLISFNRASKNDNPIN